MNRASRLFIALLALVVGGSVVILLRGHSDAAEATPEQLAERDVAERLAAAPVPPGAHRVAHLPKSPHLNGPGEEPATPNLVDRGARFVTSMSAARALAWVKAHPPAHAKRSLTGSFGSKGKILVHEVGFDWGELPRVRERALLDAVVARPGGGAAIRLDSQAVWVTPHSVAAKVPAAARLLELEYAHHGEPKRRVTVTDPGEVVEFAGLIDRAEAAQPGEYSCPEIPAYSPKLTLTFRASRGDATLAEAHQELPPGCGHPLDLTVEGRKAPTLEGSLALARRALARLGVKAGDKG